MRSPVTEMQAAMRAAQEQAQVAAQMADLAKRRKGGKRDRAEREREGHDMAGETPAMTDAHAAAEAGMEAAARESAARKAMLGNGVEPGPGTFREPEMVTPEEFRRDYLGQGHAARSPMHGPPRTDPLPPEGRGILRPLPMSPVPGVTGCGPVVESMGGHMARAMTTTPRAPVPDGAA